MPAIRGCQPPFQDDSSAPFRLCGATSGAETLRHRGMRLNNSEEVRPGFSHAGRQLTVTDHYVP